MQFKGKDRPPTPDIARKLDVDAVVEGSVSRSGDKVRITAQLIDARADKHLWAKSFERSSRDVLALQAELALPFNLALVYLGLGDRPRALDHLERALAADSQMMAWIGRDPIFDPIRSEPRFVALLKKMGFT